MGNENMRLSNEMRNIVGFLITEPELLALTEDRYIERYLQGIELEVYRMIQVAGHVNAEARILAESSGNRLYVPVEKGLKWYMHANIDALKKRSNDTKTVSGLGLTGQ
jgi:hypothetical protein